MKRIDFDTVWPRTSVRYDASQHGRISAYKEPFGGVLFWQDGGIVVGNNFDRMPDERDAFERVTDVVIAKATDLPPLYDHNGPVKVAWVKDDPWLLYDRQHEIVLSVWHGAPVYYADWRARPYARKRYRGTTATGKLTISKPDVKAAKAAIKKFSPLMEQCAVMMQVGNREAFFQQSRDYTKRGKLTDAAQFLLKPETFDIELHGWAVSQLARTSRLDDIKRLTRITYEVCELSTREPR